MLTNQQQVLERWSPTQCKRHVGILSLSLSQCAKGTFLKAPYPGYCDRSPQEFRSRIALVFLDPISCSEHVYIHTDSASLETQKFLSSCTHRHQWSSPLCTSNVRVISFFVPCSVLCVCFSRGVYVSHSVCTCVRMCVHICEAIFKKYAWVKYF